MTTKQHTGGDDAATLYALADAMEQRAAAHYKDAIHHASAGDFGAAEASTRAMRESQHAAAALLAEADAS